MNAPPLANLSTVTGNHTFALESTFASTGGLEGCGVMSCGGGSVGGDDGAAVVVVVTRGGAVGTVCGRRVVTGTVA